MKNSRGSLVRPHPLPGSASRPVVTPLSPSVVYASDTPDALDDQYEGRVFGYTYSREGHPNGDVVAARLDEMEGANGGIVTGSGMSAVSAVLLGLLSHGSSAVNFTRQLGGAFGVNLMVMFVSHREGVHQWRVSETQNWENHGTMEQLRVAQEELAKLGQTGYQSFEMSFGFLVQNINAHSTMFAYRDSFWAITIVTLLTIIAAWFTGSTRPIDDMPD